MFVVDKVVEENRRLLLANELESITVPDEGTYVLCLTRLLSSRTSVCWLTGASAAPTSD